MQDRMDTLKALVEMREHATALRHGMPETEAYKRRLMAEMRQEGNILTAKSIQADVAKNRRFTGPAIVASIGAIAQQEWNKWRAA